MELFQKEYQKIEILKIMAVRNTEFSIQKFEKFFIHHYPKVKNFARLLLKSEEEAEDISQDIFLKLWENPHIWLNNNRSLDSYLYRMTKNHIIDFLRHKKHIQKNLEYNKFNFTSEDPLSELYYNEILLILQLTLEQMPPKRKKIFKMSRLQGMSNEMIAQKLHLSIRTIEHHIYLALSDLKKTISVTFFLFFF